MTERTTTDEIARTARQRAVIATRKAWWTAGGNGHYPDCPCDRCKVNP